MPESRAKVVPSPSAFIFGPWRAVSVLGLANPVLGALFYPPVLTVPLIAADHGWSPSFAMAGFSVGLFVDGLCARYVGGAIDGFGGHAVMPAGSVIGAAGLLALVWAPGVASYFATAWITIGIAMAASLYDPAFATRSARSSGSAARAADHRAHARRRLRSTCRAGRQRNFSHSNRRLAAGAYRSRGTASGPIATPLHALCAATPASGQRFICQRTSGSPTNEDKKSSSPRMVSLLCWWRLKFASYAFVPSALSSPAPCNFPPLRVGARDRRRDPACCLVQRRSWRGSVNFSFARRLHPLPDRALMRSVCWSRLSCCWRCCRFPQCWRRSSRLCTEWPIGFWPSLSPPFVATRFVWRR